MLSRAQILAADDMRRETVPVPEWGGDVMVRTLTGTERDKLEAAYKLDPSSFRTQMCAASICDEAGIALFTPEDIPALAEKNWEVLDRLVAVATKLSAVTTKDVKDLEGN
jgi:hypothetical protein